jgi:hypothetical protein
MACFTIGFPYPKSNFNPFSDVDSFSSNFTPPIENPEIVQHQPVPWGSPPPVSNIGRHIIITSSFFGKKIGFTLTLLNQLNA